MPAQAGTKIHWAWKMAAVTFVVLMLSIALTVPRLHARADRQACLVRLQAFATAMRFQRALGTLREPGDAASTAEKEEEERIAARYYCPTTKERFVYVGSSGRDMPDDAQPIIAYEPFTDQHGEGGGVVYADGHAAFLPSNRYVAAIEAINHRRKP